VIAAFTGLLTDAVGTIRNRMDRIEDVDTVTADLLHGIVAGLEENLWMVRVQGA
jgi:starvation-inducible DNA-binding protein